MERSFKTEVAALTLGDGETFRGEGILAITKALLQSGVAYVGGYQGAPVSHLIDVLVQSRDYRMDAQTVAFGEAPADPLHRPASVNRADFQIGLLLEQVDAYDVGARTHVEDFRVGLNVHG